MTTLVLNNRLPNPLSLSPEDQNQIKPTAQETAIDFAKQGKWGDFSNLLFKTPLKQAPTAQKAPTAPTSLFQPVTNPYSVAQLVAQRATNPTEIGTIPLLTDRDTGLGKVQAQRPDGVVVGGELIQRLKGTGYVEYYLKGPQESHPLPKTISSKQEAMEHVRTEIEKGNFKDLEKGDQNAKGIRPISTVSKAPQSWEISGNGPNGKEYKGKLLQINWGTGTSNTKFVFKHAKGSQELPPTITTLKLADAYVREQIRTGKLKFSPQAPKLETTPNGKGLVSAHVKGQDQIISIDLKQRKVFSNGDWIAAGFVATDVKRYSNNPLMGGEFDPKVKGYYQDGDNKQSILIKAANGTVITDRAAAESRVKELIQQDKFAKSVALMSKTEKFNYALDVALEHAGPAVAKELRALFTPENLAKMTVLGGLQFVPGVGIAADIVVGICIGHQAIDVGIKYFNAIYTAMNATTKAELESAGIAISDATAQLGVGVGSSLVTAGVAKGMRNMNNFAPPPRAINYNKSHSSNTPRPSNTPSFGTKAPPKPVKTLKTPNLATTLNAAQKMTDHMVTAGTLGGLAYLKAKHDRGEVAIGYADQLPGMKNAVTTIFNDASANNSVAGAQRQIVVYTTKPGSKEADGYFLANVNASVASSKIFNIGNITKDIQNGTMNPGSWIDTGKINLIAQNLAAKDQTGGGVRATVGALGSINAGIYFGIPEVNTRLKASVNLMSINGTIRAMSIGPNGKKQDKTSQVEVAKALVQGYFNFYSSVPSKNSVTGKRDAQSPKVGWVQSQVNKQVGLPGGFALNNSDVQPAKKEWNLFIGAKKADGTDKRVVGETYPKGKPTTVSAFNLLLNGNKNTNLELKDVIAIPFTQDSKATGEIGRQFDGFKEAMRHAFTDPYPVGSPGYIREQQLRQNEKNGALSPH